MSEACRIYYISGRIFIASQEITESDPFPKFYLIDKFLGSLLSELSQVGLTKTADTEFGCILILWACRKNTTG